MHLQEEEEEDEEVNPTKAAFCSGLIHMEPPLCLRPKM